MKREDVISKLIDAEIDSIMSDNASGDQSVIASILEYGFKGYDNYTDKELVSEYQEVFGVKITVLVG